MEPKKRLDRARAKLLLEQPFYGVLLSMMNIKEEKNLPQPTMATDGSTIYFHPEFVDTLTDAEILGVLLHEVNHCIYGHTDTKRISSRSRELWNIACDFVINLEIVDEVNYTLPNGCLYDTKYKEMAAEEVYRDIEKNATKCPKCGTMSIPNPGIPGQSSPVGGSPGPGMPGHQCDGSGHGHAMDQIIPAKGAEEEMKEKILAAHEATKKQQGNLPGGLSRLLKELKEGKVNWQRLLARFVQESLSKDDYNWSKPNRRHLYNDVILPGMKGSKITTVVFAVDTSGSVGDKEISQILGELNKLKYLVEEITVMSCDMSVHEVTKITAAYDILKNLKLGGGGGTDFRPVFDHIHKNGIRPEVLIYLTDTYGTFPDRQPGYPVIWVSTVQDATIPWGQMVYMKFDD